MRKCNFTLCFSTFFYCLIFYLCKTLNLVAPFLEPTLCKTCKFIGINIKCLAVRDEKINTNHILLLHSDIVASNTNEHD